MKQFYSMLSRHELLLISLFFLIFLLPACASKKPEPERYVPEVLLASECGFDKLKCCATEPVCTYGQQCCTDPNNSGKNYCADDCSCGESEEFCCPGNICQNSGICQNGICFACGGEKQLCCRSGQECLAGLACQDGDCAKCGVAGGPCCPGSAKCLSLENGRAECVSGLCQNCGFDGNPPCQEGDKCLPGHFFAGKTCERCGQNNQPCCPENSAAGYDCDPAKGLKCELGFCSTER